MKQTKQASGDLMANWAANGGACDMPVAAMSMDATDAELSTAASTNSRVHCMDQK